jgi:hypothetical protein
MDIHTLKVAQLKYQHTIKSLCRITEESFVVGNDEGQLIVFSIKSKKQNLNKSSNLEYTDKKK